MCCCVWQNGDDDSNACVNYVCYHGLFSLVYEYVLKVYLSIIYIFFYTYLYKRSGFKPKLSSARISVYRAEDICSWVDIYLFK